MNVDYLLTGQLLSEIISFISSENTFKRSTVTQQWERSFVGAYCL
jgi:hypothetical protein